jgi:6-phosphogluconolactonase
VCNEGDPKTSAISSYQIDPASGALTMLNQVSSGAEGPCYIAVDASGHSAYVADYAGGAIASYVVLADGTLSQPVDRVDFRNAAVFGHTGPNKARQDGPHPHSSMLTPDNRFIVVNDLGDDSIAIFPIDPKTAHLGHPHLFQNLSPGTGPRHLAFHPNGRWAYGIDELANRIDQYLYTSTHGSPGIEAQAILTGAGRSISTLDPGYHGVNTAAEITVAPAGDFLYASNRGEDTLVVFAINGSDGALSFVQRISCGGKTPRHFTLDRTGNWIVCGNQDSASVTVFARNPGSGMLRGPVQTVALESPMFTLFA